jgi:DNA-binding winged helix-turn-helix (wHTH) protein
MVVFPPFRLDLDEGRLWKGELLLAIRRKPFEILRYLASHPKKLVTQDELLEAIWRGAVVSDSAMRSHMYELRQVLGDGVIETVIGRGYRFVAQIRDDVVVPPSAPEVADVDPLVVGREAELATLRTAFGHSLANQRQLCFVTGEPGIGKSTLIRTFLAGLDACICPSSCGCAASCARPPTGVRRRGTTARHSSSPARPEPTASSAASATASRRWRPARNARRRVNKVTMRWLWLAGVLVGCGGGGAYAATARVFPCTGCSALSRDHAAAQGRRALARDQRPSAVSRDRPPD